MFRVRRVCLGQGAPKRSFAKMVSCFFREWPLKREKASKNWNKQEKKRKRSARNEGRICFKLHLNLNNKNIPKWLCARVCVCLHGTHSAGTKREVVDVRMDTKPRRWMFLFHPGTLHPSPPVRVRFAKEFLSTCFRQVRKIFCSVLGTGKCVNREGKANEKPLRNLCRLGCGMIYRRAFPPPLSLFL